MKWNSITYAKLFLKYWKDKKRAHVEKPTALKEALKELKEALKDKKEAKDKADKERKTGKKDK